MQIFIGVMIPSFMCSWLETHHEPLVVGAKPYFESCPSVISG